MAQIKKRKRGPKPQDAIKQAELPQTLSRFKPIVTDVSGELEAARANLVSPKDVRDVARAGALDALSVIREIMLDKHVASRERVRAAEIVLQYGVAKPQASGDESGNMTPMEALVNMLSSQVATYVPAVPPVNQTYQVLDVVENGEIEKVSGDFDDEKLPPQ